jgi:hypothetical protein
VSKVIGPDAANRAEETLGFRCGKVGHGTAEDRLECSITKNPGIIVRCEPPYVQPISAMAIQKVISRAYRRIDLPHSGSHALRQTLACRLVENGGSLKEVADVLVIVRCPPR